MVAAVAVPVGVSVAAVAVLGGAIVTKVVATPMAVVMGAIVFLTGVNIF